MAEILVLFMFVLGLVLIVSVIAHWAETERKFEECKVHEWVRDDIGHLYCAKCKKRPGVETDA